VGSPDGWLCMAITPASPLATAPLSTMPGDMAQWSAAPMTVSSFFMIRFLLFKCKKKTTTGRPISQGRPSAGTILPAISNSFFTSPSGATGGKSPGPVCREPHGICGSGPRIFRLTRLKPLRCHMAPGGRPAAAGCG